MEDCDQISFLNELDFLVICKSDVSTLFNLSREQEVLRFRM